jgi:hypothetical protein
MQKVIVRFNAGYDEYYVFVSVGFEVEDDATEESIVDKAMQILASEDSSNPAIVDEVIYL